MRKENLGTGTNLQTKPLRYLAAGGKNAAEVDKKPERYRDNCDRMKYDENMLNGWFIGSGVVESGCKCVVQQRLDLSGMHWSLQGAEALLPVRALCKSERLDEFHNWRVGNLRQAAFRAAWRSMPVTA